MLYCGWVFGGLPIARAVRLISAGENPVCTAVLILPGYPRLASVLSAPGGTLLQTLNWSGAKQSSGCHTNVDNVRPLASPMDGVDLTSTHRPKAIAFVIQDVADRLLVSWLRFGLLLGCIPFSVSKVRIMAACAAFGFDHISDSLWLLRSPRAISI